MTEMRESWREVANKAESLGLKLRLHLEQEEAKHDEGEQAEPEQAQPEQEPAAGPEAATGPGAGTADTGGAPAGGSTRAAIDELADKLKDAFDSFGKAAKDPAVRSDVGEIGVLLKDALMNTFTTVGADVGGAVKDVGEAVKRAGNRSGGAQPPPPGPSGPEPASESDTVIESGSDPEPPAEPDKA